MLKIYLRTYIYIIFKINNNLLLKNWIYINYVTMYMLSSESAWLPLSSPSSLSKSNYESYGIFHYACTYMYYELYTQQSWRIQSK